MDSALAVAAGGMEEFITQDGHQYPAVEYEGVMVADAYLHDDSVLPHQTRGDLNRLFPRAKAAEAPEEHEPNSTAMLNRLGANVLKKGAEERLTISEDNIEAKSMYVLC